jgi:hypothetical protein
MLRAFGLFLLVFSLLSLIVHLNGLSSLFGVGALSLFGFDRLASHLTGKARPARMRGESLP